MPAAPKLAILSGISGGVSFAVNAEVKESRKREISGREFMRYLRYSGYAPLLALVCGMLALK